MFYKILSGFRTTFSTDTCLADYIRHGMDNGLYTGMVMIDLEKAFDTDNHSLLSDIIKLIGLDNISVFWIDSYLTNRTQKVDINGRSLPFPNLGWYPVVYHTVPYWVYCFSQYMLMLIYVNKM